MPHPPYSPHLVPERLYFCLFVSPRDFFLFSQMKKVLKGKRFANVEEVKQKTAEALKGIKIYKFRNCFEQWRNHLDRCIASNGEHFEGD